MIVSPFFQPASHFPALRQGLANLREKTKAVVAAERWTMHETGCVTSRWCDGSDAVRGALLPTLVAARKRADGDEGGAVAIFAANHVLLSAGSKNPIGLCYAGDVTNIQFGGENASAAAGAGLLCGVPWRLDKALAAEPPKDGSQPHPLVQKTKAVEGQPARVWKWYV